MNRLRGGEITREKNWRAKKTNGALSSPVRPSARFFRFFFLHYFPHRRDPGRCANTTRVPADPAVLLLKNLTCW